MFDLILSLILCLIASFSVLILINRFHICPVRSSAGVSLLLSLISYALAQHFGHSLIIFGASFVGMSSIKRFSYVDIFFGSLIFYIFYHYLALPSFIPSLGGILGFLAFCSLSIIYFMKRIF